MSRSEDRWEETSRVLSQHIANCQICSEAGGAQDGCAEGQELWLEDLEAFEALGWLDL